MNDIKQFPTDIIDKIGFYVYKLIDPRNGELFYIGKGKGNRVFDHVNGTLKIDNNDELSEDEIDLKSYRILQIRNAGYEVIHVIHRHGMDESTAFEVEAALIDDNQNYLSQKLGNRSKDFGPLNVKEIIEIYQSVSVDFGDLKVVMITINKSYDLDNIYFATRFAWKMNLNRVRNADIVCAIVKGIIKEVYIPEYWDYVTFQNFTDAPEEHQNRVGFRGVLADNSVRQTLIGKNVYAYQVKGAANPIKYNYNL